jgi:hypothetical protein
MKQITPRLSKIILLFLLILSMTVTAVELRTNYNVSEIPFDVNSTWEIQGIENTTLNVTCNGTCLYSTGPDTLSFLNITKTNITFNISVDNVTNGTSEDIWNLYHNGSIIDNFSIIYGFSIDVPVYNITIDQVTPFNNSFFGQFDELPLQMVIDYDGQIDFSASSFTLKVDDNTIEWTINQSNDTIRIDYEIARDGKYELTMNLFDTQGLNKQFYYTYQINQEDPPAPIDISPEKGSYKNEVRDLVVTMDHGNYSVFYMVNDGLPPLGSTKWTTMPFQNGNFYIPNFDFGSAGIGQVYFKITDIFGNIGIYPSAIVSGPGMVLDIEQRTKTVEPGDEIKLDLDIKIKKGSGTKFRCRLDEFDDITIPSELQIEGEDDYVNLYKDYDETLFLAEGIVKETFELILEIPLSVEIDEDYESTLECVILE